MADAPYYHVGILVADLDEAMERFSQKLGLTFAPVNDMEIDAEDDNGSFKQKMKATYSVQGPPHIELLEATGDGIFSLKNGEGVHHLGLWCPVWNEYHEQGEHRCLPVAMKINLIPGADPTMWLSNPADLHGTRLEFVSEPMKPGLEAWINGNPPQ
jgi:Glyoxalase/Bleomycin resistance protein/Dioxygenase superfamily